MISYYKTENGKITKIQSHQEGCWISCVAPTKKEVDYIISEFHIQPDFLRASLDEEESSHVDCEDGVTLIMMDSPVVEKADKNLTYYTVPLSMMITEKNVITVSLKANSVLDEFAQGLMKNVHTELKTHFIFHIILRMASKYLQYLRQIDRISGHVEKQLRKSMKNEELIQLLEIEKSLVYFSSSLKSVKATLEKIMRGRYVKLYEDDQELLEDVMIEIKQAIEMSDIYLNILSGTMDAFASIISNNLDGGMKKLSSITLILSVPTIVAGVYGMNTPNFPFMDCWWFPVWLTGIGMFVASVVLRRMGML